MRYHKNLSKYYIKWFQDCHASAVICRNRGDIPLANKYLSDASQFLTIIMENWEAIEFFSVGDRAGLIDHALPVEFRGY